MADGIRHFLVWRNAAGLLSRVMVYDDAATAHAAYSAAEDHLDCVLLGADRLSTLIGTHGDWFDEPARNL